MTGPRFPHLFSPLPIRHCAIKNRILSTGHDTDLPTNGLVNDALVAYQKARAAGGAGLIVVQVSGVHESARYTKHILMATEDDCIPGYRRLVEACHAHDCRIFMQLFHPGRQIVESLDGCQPVAYAPSVSPTERFHVTPRAAPRDVLRDIVAGFGDAARRVGEAGADGVEIVASHGYLPAQFLSPRVNRRDDEYGGSAENRLRFLREVIADIRKKAGADIIVGMRISGDEKDHEGLTEAESLAAIVALQRELDYVSVVAGSPSTAASSVHIVPPMLIDEAYVAPYAAMVKAQVDIPVFVTGRINRPQVAEQVLAAGQADMCGMTRAMICDPEMANKAAEGRVDDIRVCIGCNQACIGHFQLGYPISCIQYPESGREIEYGARRPARRKKRVLVVGGGPAGLKAAAVAAERGHEVRLFEASSRLGGQARLAQLLPGRAEFGGLVANLTREIELAGVDVVTGTPVDAALVAKEAPDAVIVATGARPRWPEIVGAEEAHVVDAWQVLRGEVNVGTSVVVADWRSDWVGLGLAEKLARDGCRVRLAVNGVTAGQNIPVYVRDTWVGILHTLGVAIVPYARLVGADADAVYMRHTASGGPITFDAVDTLVLAQGHEPVDALAGEIAGLDIEVHMAGDCLAPRTAEEAVFEGLKIANAL